MAKAATLTPINQYFDLAGAPLDAGYIYFGDVSQDPEQFPASMFWDSAGLVPALQPIRTIAGYPARNGAPAIVYGPDEYSLRVKQSNGVMVFYATAQGGAASAAALTAFIASLAATAGAWLVGFIHTAAGSIARTLGDKALDIYSPLDAMTTAQRADVRTNAATLDVKAPLQLAATHGDMPLPNGTMLVKNSITFAEPVSMIGRGPKSIVKIASDFTAATDVFIVSPTAVEKRNWQFENFQVVNAGTNARNVFRLDISTAGQFLNKLRIKGVVSDAVTGYFVELLNPLPNVDGLFTGVFEDNWSLNGYYLDNIGDSMIFQRNTTSGAGRGYYVNQLPGASHIIIRDGNCTSLGGVLIANAFNLTIEQMQFECPGTYTGSGTGYITAQNGGSPEIVNFRIRDNNINTNGGTNTTLACIYLAATAGAVIEGNTLITNGATGAHVVITSTSRDVYIGNNRYLSHAGAEIAPIVSDSGVGTMGIWKAASETTWTTGSLEFFKDRDGTVSLRGNLAGVASTSGQVITTLPVGFRPPVLQTLVAQYGTVATAVQISAAGVVTLTVNGETLCYFDGLNFSTK